MSAIVERYTWEDAVVDAQAAGLIENGALMVCLKLARAINWKPTGARAGMPSGLYWANGEAFKAVGLSRTSYYDYRKVLFEMGFFTEIKGNLIPQVPDLSAVRTDESVVRTEESVVRIEESVVRIEESVVRIEESVVRNPYSEDTYTDDSDSVEVFSETKEAPVPADAVTITSTNPMIREAFDASSFNLETLTFVDGVTYSLNTEGVTRKSVVRTEPLKATAWMPHKPVDYAARMKERPLTPLEQRFREEQGRRYRQGLSEPQKVSQGDDW